jgi:hypothetical protein
MGVLKDALEGRIINEQWIESGRDVMKNFEALSMMVKTQETCTERGMSNDREEGQENQEADREEAMPALEEPEGHMEETNGEDDKQFSTSPRRRMAEIRHGGVTG